MSGDDIGISGPIGNIPPDDQPADELTKLKNEIQILHQSVKKLSDAVAEVTITQGGIAKAITGAVNMAKISMDEILKTRQEFTAALASIQTHPISPKDIKDGMADWAAEISRVTDAKLDAFTANLQEQLAAMQGSGGGGQAGGVQGILQTFLNSEAGKAIVTRFMAPPAPVQQLGVGDMFATFLKFEKVMGELNDVRKDLSDQNIERVRQRTNDAFSRPAAAPQVAPGTAAQ